MKKVNKNSKVIELDVDEGYAYATGGNTPDEIYDNVIEVVKDMQKKQPKNKELSKIIKKATKRNKTKVRKVQTKPLSIVELYNKSFTYK